MSMCGESDYKWNRGIAPNGNLGKIDPERAADLCNKLGVPWYTTGWPYSSGIVAYCTDDELWMRILSESKDTSN